MKLKITPVDSNAEINGVWTNYRGVDLLIARGNNIKFKAIFRRLTKPYQKEMDENNLGEEKSADLLCEAMADAILLGWKNFVIEDKTIEYSKINAKNLLINDPDCREFVVDFSNEIDNFIIEDRKKLSGE